ncbi:MAG: substrate-binding periplasmic protein [Rhodospirillales bacterium]
MGGNHPTHWIAQRILAVVYAEAGLRVTFRSLPNRRSLVGADDGICDAEAGRIAMAISQTKNLSTLGPALMTVTAYAYGLDGSTEFIEAWDDLKGHAVAYVAGEVYADQGLAGMNPLQTTGYQQLFDLLERGRAEFVVGLQVPAEGELARRHLSPSVQRSRVPLYTAELFHLLRTDRPGIAAKLQPVLDRMGASGELARLQEDAQAAFIAEGMMKEAM